MSENAKWYVIHTYSGYENAVKAAIEKAVTNRGFEDMVLQTEIPLETVTEVNEAGVSKEVERKVFPGYVLLKMVLTDDTWHLIRNIRGVTAERIERTVAEQAVEVLRMRRLVAGEELTRRVLHEGVVALLGLGGERLAFIHAAPPPQVYPASR